MVHAGSGRRPFTIASLVVTAVIAGCAPKDEGPPLREALASYLNTKTVSDASIHLPTGEIERQDLAISPNPSVAMSIHDALSQHRAPEGLLERQLAQARASFEYELRTQRGHALAQRWGPAVCDPPWSLAEGNRVVEIEDRGTLERELDEKGYILPKGFLHRVRNGCDNPLQLLVPYISPARLSIGEFPG